MDISSEATVKHLLKAGSPGRYCNAKCLSFQDGCGAAEGHLAFICRRELEGLREALGSRPEAGAIGCHSILRESVHKLRHSVVELMLQADDPF